jgi:predicted nucleic acid-binding protein
VRETLVVDASIAIKWVVEEEGTRQAVGLRANFSFVAPELLVAEYANILRKKVRRGELTVDEARLAARLLERAGVELASMADLGERATALALEVDHPAYDCMYLALAVRSDLRFVTADRRLLAMIAQRGSSDLAGRCLSLDAFS